MGVSGVSMSGFPNFAQGCRMRSCILLVRVAVLEILLRSSFRAGFWKLDLGLGVGFGGVPKAC